MKKTFFKRQGGAEGSKKRREKRGRGRSSEKKKGKYYFFSHCFILVWNKVKNLLIYFIEQYRIDHWPGGWDVYLRCCMHRRQLTITPQHKGWKTPIYILSIIQTTVSKAIWKLFKNTGGYEENTMQEIICQSSHAKSWTFFFYHRCNFTELDWIKFPVSLEN